MDINAKCTQVVEAVQVLYFSNDSQKKKEANKWLENFQTTVIAWKVVDMILCDPNAANEMQFFAAQTMRKKVLTDIGQLPSDSITSLRSSIFSHIYNHRKSSKALLTQLILAVADLAVQMLDWEDPITDMENAFGSSEETIPLLIEFLKALPEECVNLRIPMDLNVLENQTKKLVDKKIFHVLDSIISFFAARGLNDSLADPLINCLQSWIKNSRPEDPSFLKDRVVLVSLLFEATQIPALLDDSIDAICELLRVTTDVVVYKNVILEVYKGLQIFRSLAEKLIADEDDDNVRSVCRLFVEAGESYLELIVRDLGDFSAILEGILLCSNYKNLEIVQLTFHFWWKLSEKLTDPDDPIQRNPAFETVFMELVKATIGHLKYPDEADQEMSAQEKEDFRSFRHEIGDCLKYCCRVIGEEAPLAFVLNQLQVLKSAGTQGVTVKWQDIECLLFALRAMGANVNPNEGEFLPKIMDLLPSLPDHPKIKYAAILVYSRYAEWTSKHLNFLEPEIKYIVNGFEHGESRAAAALALKFLCQHCASSLTGYIQNIFELFVRSLGNFHTLDTLEIMEGLGYLMNALQESDSFVYWCSMLLECLNGEFNKIMALSEREEIVRQLNGLSPSCAIKPEEHPVIKFLLARWEPLFVTSCIQFGEDERLSETISRSLIYSARGFQEGFSLVLPQSLILYQTCFSQHFLSAYIYASQQSIKIFSKYLNHVDSLFTTMVSISAQMTIRCSTEESLNNYADVVIDYFYLCVAFISSFSNAFGHSQFYENAIPLAIAAVNCEYYKSSMSAMNFWTHVFDVKYDWSMEFAAYLGPLLRQIIFNLISGCLRRFKGDSIELACEVILKIASRFHGETIQAAQEYITLLPQDRFSDSEKSIHGSKIIESLQRQRMIDLRRDISTFAALSRRRLNNC